MYGDDGFFVREAPVDHFRTSATATPRFASALVDLARRCGLDSVVDVGAGRGELLLAMASTTPELPLHGVDLCPRPADLPVSIGWSVELPTELRGLVIANELLDNVPCTVAEVDLDGVPRELLMNGSHGLVTGQPLTRPELGWVQRWWPAARPGDRIEVGTARDDAWSAVVNRMAHGLAVAIDYGHVRADRPAHGSLRSYRSGRQVELRLDGSADVTADVALDSVTAACGGRLLTQRQALRELGLSPARPAVGQGGIDPNGYLRALAAAGEAAELLAVPGLGDFGWVVTPVGIPDPFHPSVSS